MKSSKGGFMLSRTLLIFSILASSSAWGQMWGTGMYGGMQGCSYPTQVAQGAVSEDDATREARERIKEIQEQIKDKKSEKKKVDAQVKRSHSDIEKSISGEYSDFIFEHIENSRRCAQYKGHPSAQAGDVEAGGTEGGKEIAEANILSVQSFSAEQWNRFCDSSKPGSINASVCTDPQVQGRSGGIRNAQTCKKGLTEYRKNYGLAEKIQGEIEDLQEDLKQAKSELSDARKDALADRKEQTEGGVCLECMAKSNGQATVQPQTNWASVLGNVGVGLASIYAGYQTNKMITENNANLGWPTDPYAAQGYGYGLGAIGTGLGQAMGGGGSGIYGSMAGGMGSGGFGCAGMNGGMYGMAGPYGGMNGYGMWGNPYGMSMYGNNMLGGGMFNSGMGPWGLNGYNNYQQQYQQQMQRYQAMSSLQQEMSTLMYRMQQIQYGNSGYYGGYLGYSNSAYGYNSGLSVIPGSYYSSTLGTGLSTIPSTTTSTSYLLGR
ncbi:THO complex subunit 7 family protein [Bdellovibrio bacteriovorus]|nr:THO complex subunit 7 family protein [Bdellovibrio bacteriovorus]